MRTQVAIVQRRLTHYRLPLFELMRAALAKEDVELRLLVGRPTPEELDKKDEGFLDWAEPVPTRYLLDGRICWLNFGPLLRDETKLVIVPHENKLLYNLVALAARRQRRLAFWGHGRNMQSRHPEGARERFKRFTVRSPDWWFAYTQATVPILEQAGFPASKITVLHNAIDTRSLEADWREAHARRPALRAEFGLGAGPVGIYLGSLYDDKRLPFLFEACDAVRARVPDFEMLVVGDGPSRGEVEAFVAERPWARWLGMRRGAAKAQALAVSDVLLNPGLVGLGILDSFACRVPMFTTDCGIHSPEICYLDNEVNGVITANSVEAYVDAVVRALTQPAYLDALRAGAERSAETINIEAMARNFTNGILRCLAS